MQLHGWTPVMGTLAGTDWSLSCSFRSQSNNIYTVVTVVTVVTRNHKIIYEAISWGSILSGILTYDLKVRPHNKL